MTFLRQLIILISAVVIVQSQRTYENYKLYGLTPTSEQDLVLLNKLSNSTGYDFWTLYGQYGAQSDLLLEPSKVAEFLVEVGRSSMVVTTKIENVQEAINNEKVTRWSRNTDFTWDSYHPIEDINSWLNYLVETYPEAELVDGGDSYEGRDILGIKLNFGNEPKYSAVIEGGIHAREWISPATVTYILHQFLTSTDPEIRYVAELFEWHIFPSINPDGYAYTFDGDRLWRKNRHAYEGVCDTEGADGGVDLNRNWGHYWNTIGASDNPCDQTFAGPTAFSEIESQSFAEYITGVQDLSLYLAFHSYSQMVLIPYSHTTDYLDNYADVFEIVMRSMDDLEERYGTVYQVGHSTGILYPVSGSSFDWVKGDLGVDISILYELRPANLAGGGFLLSEDQILPNNEEVMASILGLIRHGQALGYYPDETDGGSPDETDGGSPDETDGGPPDETDGGPPDETDGGPPDETDGGPPDETDVGSGAMNIVFNIFILIVSALAVLSQF